MSLVNEALKKARLEAARQEAARKGIPLPGGHFEPARNTEASIWPKVILIAALFGIAVVIFLLGRRSTAPEPRVAELQAVSSETPSTPVVTAPEQQPSLPAAQAADTSPSSAPPVGPNNIAENRRSSAPPARELEVPPAPSAAVVPQDPPAQRSEPRPSRSNPPKPPEPAPADVDQPITVVRRVDLSGSRHLELGGIAWSEERPFALINGRVVGPGDTIESMTVLEVAPQFVELRGEDGHFLVRLK